MQFFVCGVEDTKKNTTDYIKRGNIIIKERMLKRSWIIYFFIYKTHKNCNAPLFSTPFVFVCFSVHLMMTCHTLLLSLSCGIY